MQERDARTNSILAYSNQRQDWFWKAAAFGPAAAVGAGLLGGLVVPDRAMTTSPYTDFNRKYISGLLGELASANGKREDVDPPVVTGGGGRTGGSGRAARPVVSEEEKAYEKALANERKLTEQVDRTMRALQDSARVAQTRADLGDVAAAKVEAELRLLRQIPELQAKTVEELGKALGYTDKMIEARREELDLKLKANQAALDGSVAAAGEAAQAVADAKKQRQMNDAKEKAKQEADRYRIEMERAIFDVANIYETAFRGGTSSLWRAFKDEGIRMIAEVAAQWTLAMVAGQPFNVNAAAGGAFGRSPISSIFFGAGGRLPANDNGAHGGIGNAVAGIRGVNAAPGAAAGSVGRHGVRNNIPASAAGVNAAPQSLLQNPAVSLGLGMFAGSLVGNGSTGSQLGGLAGSIGGKALGSTIGALGAFGGPIGAIAGAVLGSVLPGLLSGTKRGSVTVGSLGGSLGITGSQGNSKSREATAAQGAGSLIDAIFQIAGQLGGDVDASRGSVSFGMRKNSFRVDPTGRGITKIGNGAIDFGSDQEAAMRFAIQDLIKDGVITGISQASQNLLAKGGNLDKQIEKALLIEQIPKLLRQRLDPLGAALDELFEKFGKVNAALVEGRASAEQFAQARQLWELEKADAIASIGTASQSLKDFLASLNAGANSPLSLREQREEAERQLQPFIAQISAAESARAEVDRLRASGASAAQITAAEEAARTAAAGINQDGFTQASQLLLGISRQAGASSGAFFSDFDRIRALTGQGIGFVDQASARDADTRDPFARETARNTADTAAIAAEHTVILRDIRDALTRAGFYGPSSFIREDRMFVSR